ncbi:hypothetical protein L6164_034606 [Bauhinia variegata]|uniref:Uncharacterized protein n=1 Tax=Bauhinia variegata TaxID=167791 RepID=A0ACB9KVC8_BAUVA|nr:hypothetical protein L6164_034606 [Bauhinia variegata]
MTLMEYAEGDKIAGRARNIDFSVELFDEAAVKESKQLSLRDTACGPTIVTYNILISVFDRLLLIDSTEAAFVEIYNFNISTNISTYNGLIAGYITAGMWDCMEKTFHMLQSSLVKP